MRARQMFYGSLRWLSPEEDGLRQPFGADTWCRPAWIEPGGMDQIASLAITGIVPGQKVSPNVEAFWLFWPELPEDDWKGKPGDVLAVTEGIRPVAYLTVERVEVEQ
jgi:hypothetical protein